LYLYVVIPAGYDLDVVRAATVVALLIIANQFISGVLADKSKNWVRIDIVFMAMYFVVHFAAWFPSAFDAKVLLLPRLSLATYVNETVLLSLCGLAAFAVGYSLVSMPNSRYLVSDYAIEDWRKAGKLMLYSGLILTILYLLFIGKDAVSGSYSGSGQGSLFVRSTYLLQQVLSKLGIAIVLVANADERRRIPKQLFHGNLKHLLLRG